MDAPDREMRFFTFSVINTTTAHMLLILYFHIYGTLIKQIGKDVVCFWNYNSNNQNTKLETGILSKFMKGIKGNDDIKYYHCARYILTLRGGVSTK